MVMHMEIMEKDLGQAFAYTFLGKHKKGSCDIISRITTGKAETEQSVA